jgi:hypothetical protein
MHNYNITMWAVISKSLYYWYNDWLVRNQDNVSEWGDMSIRELLVEKLLSWR